MTKKLILLTLALPLVLMICLFALSKTVGQAIDAPVTGIEIVGDKIIYLDLDENESYTLNYSVFPTSAKNKDVVLKYEKIGENPLAEFAPAEILDGKVVLIPTAAGAAKVKLSTLDGGFEAGVDVYVQSSACDSIRASVDAESLFVGESTQITTEYLPSRPKDVRLSYESSDEGVLRVNEAGKITAVGRGTATVTVSLCYVPEGHDPISDTITLTVKVRDAFDLGSASESTVSSAGSISISMGEGISADPTKFSYQIFDTEGNPVENDSLTVVFAPAGEKIDLAYTFGENVFGEYVIRVSYELEDGSHITEDCTITRVRPSEFSVSFKDTINIIKIGEQDSFTYEITPADMKSRVELYDFTLSSDCLDFNKTYGFISAKKAGTCTLTLKFRTDEGAEKEFTHQILVHPAVISIKESANTYGDENLLAIGGVKADTTPSAHKLTLSTNLKDGEYDSSFYEIFSFVATNTDKVAVDGDGVIQFKDASFAGAVTFVARLSNGTASFESAPFTVYCVADGVDVYSYADLLYATREEKPAILHCDIKDDFGFENGKPVYTEIETTYDKAHYEVLKANNPNYEIPKIKILLSFKNDLYGNGYTINAGKVAYGLDPYGALKDEALFRGPMNFVSMSETGGMISVKGQDNICFAFYEGSSARNVKLYGCELAADGSGQVDLTDLTYTGTTVEILGDQVDISYARIANGRTVLRAFGDIADATKPIHLDITNSVLSGAREFIMRIGSNCFKTGDYDNPSPALDGDSGGEHNKKYNYHTLSEEKKKAYDDQFIKTFVTVKNSVFKDAGLFAVGIDSHFAGPALADGDEVAKIHSRLQGLLGTWKNLAKTSYGAKLTFEGDVRMYTWKTLDTLDSSTLIEIVGESQFADLMRFDVAEMIAKIAMPTSEGGKGFTDIVTVKDEKTYVHAGIAFFGGGKNYGVFENNLTNSAVGAVSNYTISFSDVERYYMTAAAGEEPFYFCLYTQKYGISVDKQLRDLASPDGEAYAPIKIK